MSILEIILLSKIIKYGVDGIPLPPAPCQGYNSTVIDGKVFLDGYEYKNGKWKRTLRALWHLWF